MILPAGAKNFREHCGWSGSLSPSQIHPEGKGYKTSVGDEGGFAPDLQSNEEAFS